ncbi:MAG TPA: class I SAM-dependent methyltransferase [Pirellulaceae bacterium]
MPRSVMDRRVITGKLRHALRGMRQTLWRESHRACRKVARPFVHLPEIELDALVRDDLPLEPPILDDICMPPYYGPSDHDDFVPLMRIVRFLQPVRVVELGTAHGNTIANICRQSPRSRVLTVNAPLEVQTGLVTTFDLSADDIGRVYRRHGFADRVTQLFQNTLQLDLAPQIPRGSVDLAIIDACHDTAYVLNDFQKVEPYLRPSGIVLFHDTYPSVTPSHLDGSYRACLRLRRQGFDIRHLRNTWWGVWVKPVRS